MKFFAVICCQEPEPEEEEVEKDGDDRLAFRAELNDRSYSGVILK